MRRPKKDIQLTSYDELLGLEETPEKSMNQVVEIDLAKLYPFKNHPFHVNDDEKMAETVESIKTYGVSCTGKTSIRGWIRDDFRSQKKKRL